MRYSMIDIPDEQFAAIIKRHTSIDEFDLKLSHVDVTMRVSKIKQDLQDAVDELQRRPHARRMQEL